MYARQRRRHLLCIHFVKVTESVPSTMGNRGCCYLSVPVEILPLELASPLLVRQLVHRVTTRRVSTSAPASFAIVANGPGPCRLPEPCPLVRFTFPDKSI